MLKSLHIKNYAIIDELNIDFSGRLNIITGETGAGKSILMGALSLILGDRADTSVLMQADSKCFVEGTFMVAGKPAIAAFLQSNDLEEEAELTIRREIAANGKSRSFINDTPATLQQLRALASLLVDLHQQFDTLELGDADFQRTVLDALAGQATAVQTYKRAYQQWHQQQQQLAGLQEQKQNFNKELDYFQFQYSELEEAAFAENELENIEQELQLLTHAEGIKTTLNRVYYDLKESEQPILTLVKQMSSQLLQFKDYHSDVAAIAVRLQSAHIELQDIAGEVDRLNDAVQFDEKRIETINDRLALGYKLLKKHGLKTTAELLQLQNELQQKLQAVLNIDDAIAAKEKEVATLLAEAQRQATALSAARKQQTPSLEQQVNALLAQVGMPNARLKVAVTDTALHAYGMDQVDFLFDANKSNRFEPIRKVASGGELSRLMLCIKSLVAQSIDLPTMIFDEIDTGISGEAAKQVGIIMKKLADARQVICITHQPQIAGKADAHFFVYKGTRGDAITTNIRQLTQEERILTIAQMLSGEKPTTAALENAREMVMS
ncbi:DNA repair protein RecN [Deminuibacter soli]|uniref:DNA repair protein RecN n=1 Tax=Deminuibacter soli TaxID=2291815 RepID=A0A3E1NED0_9BACT|nr:DNA repair protein RecN [Deminuibacter soli]RFM26227.1 DNA repair protein RecN [Deminuibacter soli]